MPVLKKLTKKDSLNNPNIPTFKKLLSFGIAVFFCPGLINNISECLHTVI